MEKVERRMEKIEKSSDKIEEGTRLRSGRVALGELTNAQGRDRRKPGQVKRVDLDRGKCVKRTNSIRIDENNKRCKESAAVDVYHNRTSNKIIIDKYTGIENIRVQDRNGKNRTINNTGSSIAHAIHQLDLANQQTVAHEITIETVDYRETSPPINDRITRLQVSKRNSTFYISPQYSKDIYQHLLSLEKRVQLPPNHLENKKISGKMRQVIVDWLLEVQNHFRLCQETLELTISVMDHCLAVDTNIDQENVQLVCLAAMFIAVKYEEIFLLELSDLRYVCDYSYQEKEILQMELHVLKIINFNLSHPTRTVFLGLLQQETRDNYTVEKLAKYLIDLSLLEYNMSSIESSKVAAASLYISCCVVRGTVTVSLPTNCAHSLLTLRETILLLVKKAITCRGLRKGGIHNKHLQDNRSSIRDLVQSQTYYQTLTQIISVFKL